MITSLRPGDTLGPFTRNGSYQHWNRFAAVNEEYGEHHMDDAAGQHEGFPAAFAMGPLLNSYAHVALRSWLGAETDITELGIRFRSPFLRGRTLAVWGKVEEVFADARPAVVRVALTALDDRQDTVFTALATVAVPAPAPAAAVRPQCDETGA